MRRVGGWMGGWGIGGVVSLSWTQVHLPEARKTPKAAWDMGRADVLGRGCKARSWESSLCHIFSQRGEVRIRMMHHREIIGHLCIALTWWQEELGWQEAAPYCGSPVEVVLIKLIDWRSSSCATKQGLRFTRYATKHKTCCCSLPSPRSPPPSAQSRRARHDSPIYGSHSQ